MSNWQTQFEEMRKQFQERARGRLQRTKELLQHLEKNGQDDQSMLALQKDMHWLAGVGGTYKLPILTSIGEAGEEICDQCLEDAKVLTVEQLANLRTLVVQAAEAVAAPI
jgi:chemotaxis protein histidine kinase CheA